MAYHQISRQIAALWMPVGAQWDTCLLKGKLHDTGEDAGAGCLQELSRRRCGWLAASYPCVREQLLLSFCLEEILPCTEAGRIFCLCEGLALARSPLCVRWFWLSSEWCAHALPPFPLLHFEDYMACCWSILSFVALPVTSVVLLWLLLENNDICCS